MTVSLGAVCSKQGFHCVFTTCILYSIFDSADLRGIFRSMQLLISEFLFVFCLVLALGPYKGM